MLGTSYTLDLFVAQVNLLCIVVAFGVNWWAIKRSPPQKRPIRAMITCLCGLYVVAYIWLLSEFPERILMWSRYMRGVSIVVWGVVWIAPAIMDVRIYRARQSDAQRLADGVAERLKDAA